MTISAECTVCTDQLTNEDRKRSNNVLSIYTPKRMFKATLLKHLGSTLWSRVSQKLYGPMAEDMQKQPSMSILSCKDAEKANCLNSLFQHAKYLNSISGLAKCFQCKAQVHLKNRKMCLIFL